MISYLNGKIAHKGDNFVIVDVGGIGFKAFMPTVDIARLPDEGSETKVYTYMYVREDAMELYGFCELRGIECFNKLISVNGVGCKAALAILSVLPPSELSAAIAGGDVKSITRAQGVGSKIAQRIVLELKDKLDILPSAQQKSSSEKAARFVPSAEVSAINALISLGCSPSEARRAVSEIASDTMNAEEIIREALRRLSNGI